MSPAFELFLAALLVGVIGLMIYDATSDRCDPDLEKHCRVYEHYLRD